MTTDLFSDHSSQNILTRLSPTLASYTQSLNSTEVGSSSVEDLCSRSDADANVGVYTFHLVGILGMATVCIVGNCLVIFVMTKECKLNTPLNCFIVSLACSDLCQGVLYAIYNVSHINVKSVRGALGE